MNADQFLRAESARRRKLARDARRLLRSLKVGVIPDLLAEVLDADKRSNGTDVAMAYLVVLTRRAVSDQILRRPPDLQAYVARRIVNHVRRVEQLSPLPDVLDGAPLLPAVAPIPPEALPAPMPRDRDRDRDQEAEEAGRRAQEAGGDWRDNPRVADLLASGLAAAEAGRYAPSPCSCPVAG